MKTQLQKALQKIAPSISIQTLWEYDPDLRDIRQDCDGFDDENPEDWQAWQSEIRATIIQDGEEFTGHAYLGGTWEKAGDDPAESNPEISGYELQMTAEAIGELPLSEDRARALAWLTIESVERYEAQRAAARQTETPTKEN